MNGEHDLRSMRDKEYEILNSFTKNYRMPVEKLGGYTECLDRIRALNKRISGID